MPFQTWALAHDFWEHFLKVFALVASTFLDLLVTTVPSVVLPVTSLWLTHVHISWSCGSARFDRPPAWLGQSPSESPLKHAGVGGDTPPPRRGPCHSPCKAGAGGRAAGRCRRGETALPGAAGIPAGTVLSQEPAPRCAPGLPAAGLGGSPGQPPGGGDGGTGLPRGEEGKAQLCGAGSCAAHTSAALPGGSERA